MVDQFFMSLTTFGTTIILARTFDVLVYADFVLLITITVFVLGFQSSLISKPYAINLRDFKKIDGEDYFQFTLNSKLLFTLIVLAFFPLTYYLAFKEWNTTNVAVFTLFIVSYTFYYFIRETLLSERKTRINMNYGLFCSLLLTSLLFIIWFYEINDIYFYLFFASCIYLGLSAFYLVRNYSWKSLFSDNFLKFFRSNWKVGKWLVGSNFLFHLAGNIYPWLLLLLTEKRDVAVLGVLLSIASIISPLLQALGSYLLPLFVGFQNNPGRLRVLVKWCFFFSGILAFLIIGIGHFFGQGLMSLLFGSKYDNLGGIVFFPFLVQAIVIFFQPIKIALTAIKRTDVDFWIYIPRSLIAVALGYFLIKQYGIYGVFYTMLIENVFYQFIISVVYYNIAFGKEGLRK